MTPFKRLASMRIAVAFAAVHCAIVHPHLVQAEVKLPAIFTDHAVLQRDMPVPVWGWADPGEEVTVAIAGQTHKATADDKGKWRVTLGSLVRGRAAQAGRRRQG